jgi:hypothetical protein
MKRTLISLMAAVGVTLAGLSASAAVVTLTGPATATPGSAIILTATGSTGVGPADVAATNAGGNITYQDALVNTNVAVSEQFLIPGLGGLGGLDCTTARCRAFNQIGVLGAPAFVPNVTDFVISRTSFIIDPAAAPGTVVTFNWQSAPSSQALNFFGAVAGPGVQVQVVPIPEPTTMAMVGLGLLGLAMAGRRRS